jgi:phage/plasmid-associated DNA primase
VGAARCACRAGAALTLDTCPCRQVEALRDNLQQVGAQKVLHEQQAEMWKQKHAAMEKLVDHLEVLTEGARVHTHARTRTHTHAHARKRTYARTNTRTHTHTHTHRLSFSLSLSLSLRSS